MGKGNRIKSDRAKQMVERPDQFAKKDSNKAAKTTTIVLVCVLLAIVIAVGTLVALDNSGTFLRSSIVYQSDNFAIDGIMATYMYNSLYQSYYSLYGDTAQYFVTESTITSQAKSMLVLCEAAKAAGVSLDDADHAKIDKSLAELKEQLKESGYSISQLYGSGVTENDIRKVSELQTLASKFQTAKEDELTDKYFADAEAIDKYFEENKSTLLSGGYISAKTDNVEWRAELLKATTAEEFKTTFIKLYVTENFVAEYQNTEKEDLAADEKVAVSLLESLAQAIVEAIDFASNGTEVEVSETEVLKLESAVNSKVTDAMVKAIYEKKYLSGYKAADGETGIKEVSASVYKSSVTAATALQTAINKVLLSNSSYKYPNKTTVSGENYLDTEPPVTENTTDSTTAGTTAATTTAGSTTAGTTTAVDETPAKPDELNKFDTWFFDAARKDNDVTEIADMVYFVTDAGVKDETVTKNIAHILISAEAHDHADETTDAEHAAEEQAELDLARAEAESILAEFKNGTLTQEAFEALAEKYTDDSGVVYENVTEGEMVDEFNDWIFDSARNVGDTDIVQTDYGFHVMYFIGNGEVTWKVTTVENMVSEDMTEWTEELETKHAVKTVDAGLKKVFG